MSDGAASLAPIQYKELTPTIPHLGADMAALPDLLLPVGR